MYYRNKSLCVWIWLLFFTSWLFFVLYGNVLHMIASRMVPFHPPSIHLLIVFLFPSGTLPYSYVLVYAGIPHSCLFMIAMAMMNTVLVFHRTPLLPLAFTFLLPSLPSCSEGVTAGVVVLWFRTEDFRIAYFQHFDKFFLIVCFFEISYMNTIFIPFPLLSFSASIFFLSPTSSHSQKLCFESLR